MNKETILEMIQTNIEKEYITKETLNGVKSDIIKKLNNGVMGAIYGELTNEIFSIGISDVEDNSTEVSGKVSPEMVSTIISFIDLVFKEKIDWEKFDTKSDTISIKLDLEFVDGRYLEKYDEANDKNIKVKYTLSNDSSVEENVGETTDVEEDCVTNNVEPITEDEPTPTVSEPKIDIIISGEVTSTTKDNPFTDLEEFYKLVTDLVENLGDDITDITFTNDTITLKTKERDYKIYDINKEILVTLQHRIDKIGDYAFVRVGEYKERGKQSIMTQYETTPEDIIVGTEVAYQTVNGTNEDYGKTYEIDKVESINSDGTIELTKANGSFSISDLKLVVDENKVTENTVTEENVNELTTNELQNKNVIMELGNDISKISFTGNLNIPDILEGLIYTLENNTKIPFEKYEEGIIVNTDDLTILEGMLSKLNDMGIKSNIILDVKECRNNIKENAGKRVVAIDCEQMNSNECFVLVFEEKDYGLICEMIKEGNTETTVEFDYIKIDNSEISEEFGNRVYKDYYTSTNIQLLNEKRILL